MLIRLNAKPLNINIVELYVPTADKDEHEIEEYHQIEEVLITTKKHEITILVAYLHGNRLKMDNKVE